MALKIDELNNLKTSKKRKVLPYRQYFEEMDLNEEQIEQRVEHSKGLSPILFFIINLVLVYIEFGYQDFTDVQEELRQRYIELLGSEGIDIDPNVADYIERFAEEFVKTTVERANEEFFTTEDRADVVAENEANTIYNFEDFKNAVKAGKKYKMWVTEHDDKVRKTHTVVDGDVVEIDQYFKVGESYLLYPKDMSMDPSLEETANCRCTVIYV